MLRVDDKRREGGGVPREIAVDFELDAASRRFWARATFRPPTKGFTAAFRNFLKVGRVGTYCERRRTVGIDAAHFAERRYALEQAIRRRFCAGATTAPRVSVAFVPQSALIALHKSDEDVRAEHERRARVERNVERYLPRRVRDALKPYQREAVVRAALLRGRVLIADEMGLGKTFEAIAAYRYFRSADAERALATTTTCAAAAAAAAAAATATEAVPSSTARPRPLLVICPSSLRTQWAHELCKWLGEDFADATSQILVVAKRSDYEKAAARGARYDAVITSYELASALAAQLGAARFGTAIVDESHMLKNWAAQRTRRIAPLLRAVPRVLLLSGTPALARPKELFTQAAIVDASLFPSFHEYGVRYCAGHEMPYTALRRGAPQRPVWDYTGASHLAELHAVLAERVMVRRLKGDVLRELPAKIRQKVFVTVPLAKAARKKMSCVRTKIAAAAAAAAVVAADTRTGACAIGAAARDESVLEMYQAMAKHKAAAACKYVEEFFAANGDGGGGGDGGDGGTAHPLKFLVFAHHRAMLDALEAVVKNKLGVGYVRIDGATSMRRRADAVAEFQADGAACRVALLSIMAAGVGLTLTKATVAIFAELHWTPGMLLQAEDRAHRIGQRRPVVVQYLVGEQTMEEDVWRAVEHKIDVVSSLLDGGGGGAASAKRPRPDDYYDDDDEDDTAATSTGMRATECRGVLRQRTL